MQCNCHCFFLLKATWLDLTWNSWSIMPPSAYCNGPYPWIVWVNGYFFSFFLIFKYSWAPWRSWKNSYGGPGKSWKSPGFFFTKRVGTLRPMYNMHPHISTQEVSISAKNDDKRMTWSYAAVRKSSWKWPWSVSIVAVTNVWPLAATSVKPNHSWMHGPMTALLFPPSVAVWRSVRTSPPPRLYYGCGGWTQERERRADSASQMLQHELKAPSRHGAVAWSIVGLFAKAAPVFR